MMDDGTVDKDKAPPKAASPLRTTPKIDALIDQLEQQMPDLQMRNGNVFALANAWAARYDAIIAETPLALRPDVAARLSRIGIRWGVAPGARVTTEFRALDPAALPPDWQRRTLKGK